MILRAHAASRRKPHRGDTWILAVTPPPCYAGTVGARASVESVSRDGVYVRFESGLRECYPPGRFAAYFELGVASDGDQCRGQQPASAAPTPPKLFLVVGRSRAS